MKQNSNAPFFDKNTFTAIMLSFAVFFLWQMYVSKKYPQQEVVQEQVSDVAAPSSGAPNTEAKKVEVVPSSPVIKASPSEVVSAKTISFNTPAVSATLTNLGMGFKDLSLNQLKDRDGQPIKYDSQNLPSIGETSVNGTVVLFDVAQTSTNEFVGNADINGIHVVKTLNLDPEKFTATITTVVTSAQRQAFSVSHKLVDYVHPVSTSFLLPSYEHQEFFVIETDGKNRQTLSLKDATLINKSNVTMASLNSHYFSLALLNMSDLMPKVDAEVNTQSKVASMDILYKSAEPTERMEVKTLFYFGPKDLDILKSINPIMTEIIDFGFFSFIGKPLLATLKFIFTFMKNWGVSIILLTIFLRLLLLPMNLYSFNAMKRMQKVQPRLKEIKEKYKSDPQRVNQETLQVMRSEKANPISGCLPMLMQIPIFFALYQVLGKSIELYQAPFAFWIHDLSLKDPFFVLPILVGVTFFIQQKITPATSMDPAQQKVMLFMPLIFSVFMLSVPSGLTLYMFVNSLFGIIQQFIFTRQTTA